MRKSDNEVKNRLRRMLSEAFCLPIEKVALGKTTDLVVEIGESADEWLYFEIKSTDVNERRNKKAYFGAISLKQLVESYKHPKRYFFIIVSSNLNVEKYAIVTPQVMLSYITGCYTYADFLIPDNKLQDCFADSASFKKLCTELHKYYLCAYFPENTNPKQDIISKINLMIKQYSDGTN